MANEHCMEHKNKTKKHPNRDVSGRSDRHCITDLTLLPFLGEDVTDQNLLKNFLFDEEMPKTAGREGQVVLCPEKQKHGQKHMVNT